MRRPEPLRDDGAGDAVKLDARRRTIAAVRDEMRAARDKMLAQVRTQVPIHPAWLAHCLNEAKSDDAIFINELGIAPNRLDFKAPLSFIGTSLAGGLGAGLGSALGAKLAARDREVIVAVGDGSYMFGNPVPYHFVQRAENLPTLTIVANNHQWLAVKQSTLAVYPAGAAAKANVMPIQDLNPSPAFEKVAQCCDGWAMSVEDPAKLPDAMRRAFENVRSGVPALLNVHVQGMR
jgi:acetolactate synthase-1/2/3 large subunit